MVFTELDSAASDFRKYNAIDLVPTLSDLLQIPRPDKSQGITITPVLSKK